MITGFGNNVISSLAADITAGQTTIQVMPGTGAKFAGLLNYDYANASNPLQTYAKITLTDAKETVFEICHLTSVNNDVLTVVRGQEGTTAKGWALNDVIANFATRGSENQFVQIEQLQSGHYISGVAGGTANALTLELPATYFVNGSTDWTLRTPLVVYPTQNNTGASTLLLTMGGRVLGTFKLYKGNKAELVANDILKDIALVCLLDKTKSFFNVSNPGAIYAGLGTAAFCDVTTSPTDTTLGRVPTVGWMGNGTSIALPENSDLNTIIRLVATYGVANPGSSAKNFPINLPGVLRISHNSDGRTLQEYTTFNPVVKYERALYSSGTWSAWVAYYSPNKKPTAADVGALPLSGGDLTGPLNLHDQLKMYTGSNRTTDGHGLIQCYDVNNILAMNFGYYGDAFSVNFYDAVTGAWKINPLVVGSNGNTTVNGNLSGNRVYEGNQRVYSPNNPQPINLSAYATMDWSNSRFLQGERLGAIGHVDNGNVGSVPVAAPDGSVITKIWMQGNWVAIDYRPKQYLLNGTWYNAGVA